MQRRDIPPKLRRSHIPRMSRRLTLIGQKISQVHQVLPIRLDRQIRCIPFNIQIPQKLRDFLMHPRPPDQSAETPPDDLLGPLP